MSYQIAFIGYGLRSETMMTAFRSIDADISVAAVCDPREAELRKRTAGDPMFASTTYYTDAAEMLDAVKPDGVFVGTRCGLHTPMAKQVLSRGLPLFL